MYSRKKFSPFFILPSFGVLYFVNATSLCGKNTPKSGTNEKPSKFYYNTGDYFIKNFTVYELTHFWGVFYFVNAPSLRCENTSVKVLKYQLPSIL